MPYQIKNGIIYSGNAVTLTQAQYDALSSAEKNNGTVYYIYDSDAMIEAQEVGLDGGNVETLAGSVATFESSPSTAVHAAGEYILYNAQLYKVTSAIAVGEDLTVGSNIEATNLGNELNAGLNAYTYYTAQTTLSTTIKFWKHGRFVLFQHDENFEVPAGTEHQIAIIPNGIIPAAVFAFSLAVCNSGAIVGSARIRMHSDGSVKLISSVSGYQEYHVAGIYLTN